MVSELSLNQRSMRTLRENLARKYPMAEQARVLVQDANLEPIRIAFHNRADLTWSSVLDEAQKQGGRWLAALIERALQDYPEDEVLLGLREGVAVQYSEGPSVSSLHWRGRGGQPFEKLLGKQSSLVPVSFLEVGMRRARAVARIRGGDGSLGTGFLIPGDLLVTNHHVLRDRDAAAGATVHFNYQKTVEGGDADVDELRLDTDAFFTASSADDCTIVKVRGEPSARWGAIDIDPAPVRIDDRINIIQHAGGEQKQLSFFHNLVVYVGEGRVQYLTDTMPGSSGSPVFDKDWRLVALHHSGGWIPEPGSRDHFFRNEGIQVDRVLHVLRRAT